MGIIKAPKRRSKPYQTGQSDRERDRLIKAKPPGKRVSESGKTYTERRRNRSDLPNKRV